MSNLKKDMADPERLLILNSILKDMLLFKMFSPTGKKGLDTADNEYSPVTVSFSMAMLYMCI